MTPSMNFLVIKYSIPHTALTQAAISSDHAMSQLPQLLKCCTHTAAASFTCHCPALPQPCAGFLLFHFAGTFASHGTFILIHPNDGIKLIWGKKKKKSQQCMKEVLMPLPVPIPGGLKDQISHFQQSPFWSSVIADMLPCVTPISVLVLYVEIDICYCYILANVKKMENH